MERLNDSKYPKLNSTKKSNENNEVKCKMKLEYPPVSHSGDFYTRTRSLGNSVGEGNSRTNKPRNTKNSLSRANLKFQCHFEERKNRREIKRRKIIQRLKKLYEIDVEGLNENVTKEIIMKVETLEKEKKQREQREVEKTVTMITRLLEEQKYKSRGHKLYHPPWRKSMKSRLISQTVSNEEEEVVEELELKSLFSFNEEKTSEVPMEKVAKISVNLERKELSKKPSNDSKQTADKELKEEVVQEEENLPKCVETKPTEGSALTESYKKITRRSRNPACTPTEKNLESSPKVILFQDYEKGKIYLQDLKITNIGLETIHCRYLGIVVHTKIEEKFPVGVAVRDNVKLRPGLSCSTKIRLCSQDDTQELQCSIVYETRRQNKLFQHSWFFVKVVCVPVRATVKISPLKLVFPSLTWCEATGTESARLLKKYIRIENTGGKACSCRISGVKTEKSIEFEEIEGEDYGEGGEMDYGTESTKSKSDLSKTFTNARYSFSVKEYPGEAYTPPWESLETAEILFNELLENVFTIFRFSEKYYIELPPFTTKQIEVRFIPHYKGFHHEMKFLQFENCHNCQEQTIELMGDIKRMPLRVEPQVIDLRICVANSGVYASTFKIYNESKGPYSVIVKTPRAIKNHAHVHPRAATILPRNCSQFSVRVYPRVSLARDAPRYFKEDFQVLEFPLFIYGGNVGSCKLDSRKIYVCALITDYCLQLSPSFIDFEKVTTLETVRTELQLTNYSLAIQEFGFLNLPKGVRIEPNMGFGKILPKETITLDLLYSPGHELRGGHEFQIEVTSIAKYGGLREKLEPIAESEETIESFWGEEYYYSSPSPGVTPDSNDPGGFIQNKKEEDEEEEEEEEEEDFDACEEESSVEGEELAMRIVEEENTIRRFLKQDRGRMSELSIFKKMNLTPQDYLDSKELAKGYSDAEVRNFDGNCGSEFGEFEESEIRRPCELKPDLHIVSCRACVVQPRCRISESVIQLPATPCSSFSLYRFRLSAMKEPSGITCDCGFRKALKKCQATNFQASFEFQNYCPHIKLEPESGCIKAGESMPITIIYRPEFPAEQLCQESRLKKAEKIMSAKKEEASKPAANTKQSVAKLKQPTSRNSARAPDAIQPGDIQEIINTSLYELEKYDLFAGERSLQELINPFYVETKVRCIVKNPDNEHQVEILEMMLICPAIKPNFIYLGNSQEINFNKVFVGTRARAMLRAQNVSFERISPLTTALNPGGPFFCPGGLKKVKVDPEHIWVQPLIYAPLGSQGIDKQYFEIYYGATNIFLAVSGEGIQPQYKINPSFACCLIDAKPGSVEELKLEIENLNPIKFNVQLQALFVKEGPDVEEEEEEGEPKMKKEKSSQKEESKEKKKSKNSESDKNCRFFDEIPEVISSSLEGFDDVEAESASKVFILQGFGDGNEVWIPPYGRLQVRIQFAPPADKSGRRYAIKYVFVLERVSPLKEILVVGKISKGK